MKERYQHYKGTIYEVLGTVRHTETGEFLMVYKQWKDPGSAGPHDFGLWARPMGMFHGVVEHDGKQVPRFKLLPDLSPGPPPLPESATKG